MARPEAGFDYEPSGRISIVEVGPGPLPAYNYLRRFKKPIITFIDDRPLKFDLAKEFPGATFVRESFLKYSSLIENDSIDILLLSNVLTAPYDKELITFEGLVSTSARILKGDGLLVVENTYDGGSMSTGRIIKSVFDLSDKFDSTLYDGAVSSSTKYFLHPNEAGKNTFSLHIRKKK